MERIVIIGTGQGGQQAAASLRQDGFAGTITLIGDEPGLPYQRPPLSKAYMADGEADRLLIKPTAFYDRSQIMLRERTRITAIDRPAREVVSETGERIPYDHLILALGARNATPPLPGLDRPSVHGLRTLADAARLRERLATARHVVVVGGGFIGLEFAAMARKAGVDVTVLEAGPRLMARAVSAQTSARFLAHHEAMGTDVRLNAMAGEITAEGVVLKDATLVEGDLILIATGVRPNVELAAEAGLEVDNGIVVDSTLLTSDPAISALGDVAAFPWEGEHGEGGHVRLESVQAAVDHARHIALRLTTGSDAPYDAVPWFWSDQGSWKLQIAGLATGADDTVSLPQATGEPVEMLFRAGHLVAVETINAPGVHMAARRLIGTPRAGLEAVGYDLRAVLKAKDQGA